MSENESTNQAARDGEAAAAPESPSWARTLARLWCLNSVHAAPGASPAVAILSLSLAWIAAWVLIDRWERQPDPEFSVDGIPLLAWYVLAALGLAALLRRMSNPRPRYGAALVLTLGLTPLPMLVSVLDYILEPAGFWCASGAAALYAVVYLMRGLRAVSGRSQRAAAALMAAACLAAFMALSSLVSAIPDLWNPRDPNASLSDDELAQREAALFEQADRIDAALQPIHRGNSAGPEAFFLGFAGVGDEKVFAQEVQLASRILTERYRMGDRHLSLINDERDLEHAPLASVSGLRYALQGLAARMDLSRDVLFLSISSHGSDDPVIAVSNSQFPLQYLSSEDLVDALHQAGIKWRVIIISACYAGGFIDSLRDPQTIVITAAAKDRTSFGCSSDSDLTYFGEAFYRDALPYARSLRDAFEKASTAIAGRERDESVTPSEPQAWFGTEMESKLAEMRR